MMEIAAYIAMGLSIMWVAFWTVRGYMTTLARNDIRVAYLIRRASGDTSKRIKHYHRRA